MSVQIFGLATLIVYGVMLANMLVQWQGTKVFLDGIGNLWAIGINGMLGKPAKER